jgi:thiol-disulfide isomerase/thioredoxin
MSKQFRASHPGLLLLFVMCCSFAAAESQHLPNLAFENLTGNKVKIGDLRGSVAVVNFWATWCAPCRQELPMLSRLSLQFAGKKVRFVAISIDENPSNRKQRAKIDQFLSEQKLAMEIWLGGDLDSLARCGLGEIVPGTISLDSNGQVVSRVEGQAHEEDITVAVQWILDGEDGPAPETMVKRY